MTREKKASAGTSQAVGQKRRGAAEPAHALESVLIAIQELSPSREIP
jgi:hypothetical protein